MKARKRVRNNSYAESENGRRPGAFVEVPLMSRKKRKQGARKKIDPADRGAIFEEPMEDGEAYAYGTANSLVSCCVQCLITRIVDKKVLSVTKRLLARVRR